MSDSHTGRPGRAGPEASETGPTDEERAAATAPYGIIEGLAPDRIKMS
jgi:hypothetical protein